MNLTSSVPFLKRHREFCFFSAFLFRLLFKMIDKNLLLCTLKEKEIQIINTFVDKRNIVFNNLHQKLFSYKNHCHLNSKLHETSSRGTFFLNINHFNTNLIIFQYVHMLYNNCFIGYLWQKHKINETWRYPNNR